MFWKQPLHPGAAVKGNADDNLAEGLGRDQYRFHSEGNTNLYPLPLMKTL